MYSSGQPEGGEGVVSVSTVWWDDSAINDQ